MILHPFYTTYYLVMIIVKIIDRTGVNVANNMFGKHWLYFIDKKAQGVVYRDMSSLTATGFEISDASREDVKNARNIAIHARRLFDGCNPDFHGDHWHYQEVKVEALAARVSADRKSNVKWRSEKDGAHLDMIPFLTDEELRILQKRFNWAKTQMDTISFSKFCLFIGEALHGTRKFLKDEDVGNAVSQMYEN